MADEHERIEDKAEIARHHRDFARISSIVDEVLNSFEEHGFGWKEDRDDLPMVIEAFKQIRGIVG